MPLGGSSSLRCLAAAFAATRNRDIAKSTPFHRIPDPPRFARVARRSACDGDSPNHHRPTMARSPNLSSDPLRSPPSPPPHHHLDDDVVHYHDSPFLLPRRGAGAESAEQSSPEVVSALIVLNSPISDPPSPVFEALWDLSSHRVCADGGANRLYDATSSSSSTSDSETSYVPDLIRGDLDSLRPDVRSHYESLGCAVERDPDQDTNDLDKCLQAIHERMVRWTNRRDKRDHSADPPPPAAAAQARADDEEVGGPKRAFRGQPRDAEFRVYIYGAFGGRFDQEMGCVQALFKWSERFRNRVVLYGDETCAFLLPPGVRNEIRLPTGGSEKSTAAKGGGDASRGNGGAPPAIVGEGRTCGLIPLGCRCEFVKTTGLQWNLDGASALEFGGLVSTSNRIVEDVVTVRSSHPIVFTTEMRS